MILLDTNVISALTRSEGDAALTDWLNLQAEHDIWTTSVNVFEIEFGISILPPGRRRTALRLAWDDVLRDELAGRVVPFDDRAARSAAHLAARRQTSGRTVDIRDTQIAGIALAHRATVATRNIRHFQDLDTPVINPWNAAS